MIWARRLKEATGFAVGSVTGGVSQEKAAAGLLAAKSSVLSALERAGEKVGASGAGSNVFSALARGAEKTDRQASQQFFIGKVGVSPDGIKALLVVFGALGVIWFLLKGGRG